LSLAGCGLTGEVRAVPVDDAFDGMVTDVVRFDDSTGFLPLAVGADGAVAGIQDVWRGPFSDPRRDFVVIEPDGSTTVILGALDESSWPVTVALSESMVAWTSTDVGDDTTEGKERLFTRPRHRATVTEMTNEVVQAGSNLDLEPWNFHVVGDTVIGAASELLEREVLVFALSAAGEDRFLLVEDVIPMGGQDDCTPAHQVRLVNLGTDPAGDVTPWEVVFTTVPESGPISSERVELPQRNSLSTPRYLGYAACGDAFWYNTESGESRFVAERSMSDPTQMEAYPLPIPHAADLWANSNYVIGSQVTGQSFVLTPSTGATATNPSGMWCSTVDVTGDYMVWQEQTQEPGPFDGSGPWRCQTFVGRFAPVDS
jgi:hypothetical protein